ncbi:MAG: energy transducer TonB [Bacteroidales bacterium]|nr:energy transducer TonB [Bacteroidales bacterium]
MELKKNPKVDLERKRSLFFEIALFITLGIVFVAFEIKIIPETDKDEFEVVTTKVEEEIIPITKQEEIKLPPPPPPPVTDIIQVVENNQEIKNEVEIQSTEATVNTQIEAPVEVKQEEEVEEVINFYVIEEKPEFPGGEAAMMQWIAKNIKYPEIAKENNIQGKVFVQFIIDKDGQVKNVEVVRGVDPVLDREAVRVVSSMPQWKPGKQRGKPVKVQFQLPINFRLN